MQVETTQDERTAAWSSSMVYLG